MLLLSAIDAYWALLTRDCGSLRDQNDSKTYFPLISLSEKSPLSFLMLNTGAVDPIFASDGSVNWDEVKKIVNAAANKIDHDFTILQFKFANKTLQEDYSLSLSPHRFSVVE